MRCRPDELTAWKDCAARHGISLSAYARVCLNRKPPLSRIVKIDPLLVRHLAAIGNNLNQIARQAHISLSDPDRRLIERELSAILFELQKLVENLESGKC